MRILHISDNHSRFWPLKNYVDVIVNSGDMFPDPPTATRKDEWQKHWVEQNIEKFKNWLSGRPYLFCSGNHDFLDGMIFEGILRDNNIEAYCLNDKVVNFDGVQFYGFPYVPTINGRYNFECDYQSMMKHVERLVDTVNNLIHLDILVCHCPPSGVLDYCFNQYRSFGNAAMTNALSYKIKEDKMPSAYLTGHIHSSQGITTLGSMIVSNAATTQHIISGL